MGRGPKLPIRNAARKHAGDAVPAAILLVKKNIMSNL